MSECRHPSPAAVPLTGITVGVTYYAATVAKVGFWWSLLYGVFWPVLLGYVMAERLGLGR